MVQASFHGFLCVNKAAGITSRDAVNVVQRLVRPAKVGHAGTLDPLATGVLVIAIGKATRLISSVQSMPKRYLAEFRLGSTSDTEDITGTVVEHQVERIPELSAVEATCAEFVGSIQQRPPIYSALKVKGKRAYKLARAGQDVKLEPRTVDIHAIKLMDFEYPKLTLDVVSGSGTYIRSLGRDIGESLGCGAVMSDLTRTEIGNFQLTSATILDELTSADEIQKRLLPMLHGLDLPQVELDENQMRAIGFGQEIDCPTAPSPEFAAVNSKGDLIAVMRRSGNTEGRFRPGINFAAKT